MEITTGFLDLPIPIIVDILLQLSAGIILICKCVCKAWQNIIIDPQFTKLYYARIARADVYPLIRPISPDHISRTLHLINPKYHYKSGTFSKGKFQAKFQIPLRNFESALRTQSHKLHFQEPGERKRKRRLGLSFFFKDKKLELSSYDQKFDIVNSCNGFLCLSGLDIAVVSNPVTGEFVNIPAPLVFEIEKYLITYGLGFSPRTNSYKVVGIFGRNTENWVKKYGPLTGYQNWSSSYAQIQTIGSSSWKPIGLAPFCSSLKFATYVNGTLNWLVDGKQGLSFIASFDFDNDLFGSFQLPPGSARLGMRLGLLKDHICYSVIENEVLHIWEMNEYSVEGSWTKVCDLVISGYLPFTYCDIYQPMVRLEDGTILLFHSKPLKRKFGMIYYEPTKQTQKYLSVQSIAREEYEAICYTPSFVTLKDVLAGDDVEVLNVKSRCAELKLQCESRSPYLVQRKQSA